MNASVASVWELELLLLLRRGRDRDWTHDQLVRELRASPSIIGKGLERLQKAGLVVADDALCRYAAAGRHLDELVDRLDQLYRARPTTVMNAVLGAPNAKLQSFADAFRLKKD